MSATKLVTAHFGNLKEGDDFFGETIKEFWVKDGIISVQGKDGCIGTISDHFQINGY